MVLSPPHRRLVLVAALAIAAALALASGACGDDDNNGSASATSTSVAQPPALPPGETPTAGATPVASDIAEDHPAVVAARQHLLDNVAIEPANLRFVSAVAKTFSNACLDVQALSSTPEVCAQVVTPGYEIVFSAGSTLYTYRTDESATNVRFAGVDIGGGPSQIDVP